MLYLRAEDSHSESAGIVRVQRFLWSAEIDILCRETVAEPTMQPRPENLEVELAGGNSCRGLRQHFGQRVEVRCLPHSGLLC